MKRNTLMTSVSRTFLSVPDFADPELYRRKRVERINTRAIKEAFGMARLAIDRFSADAGNLNETIIRGQSKAYIGIDPGSDEGGVIAHYDENGKMVKCEKV